MTLSPRLTLMLVLAPLFWAGNAVAGRIAVAYAPPLLLNVLRWSLAGLVLLVLGRRVWRTAAARRDVLLRWRELALLGLFGVGAYNAFQYSALVTSTPINITLIAASGPLWTLVFGALFFGEPVQRRQLLGVAFSVAGVLTVLGRGELEALFKVHLVPGDLLMLCGQASWAVYTWMLARPAPRLRGEAAPQVDDGGVRRGWNWAESLLAQVGFGLVWAGLAACGEHLLLPQTLQLNGTLIATLAYIVVGPSLLAYACWGSAVAQAGPAMAAFFANLTPLFAALMSTVMLGEAPRWYHALAFVLIVAGIQVARPAPRQASPAPRKAPG